MKKGVLRNFAKFTAKHLCQNLFFNKVAGLRPATLLKKRPWHRCFPVSFAKFLRTPFYRRPLDDCFCINVRPLSVNLLVLHHSQKKGIDSLEDSLVGVTPKLPYIETSQLICSANQLTGFYMMAAELEFPKILVPRLPENSSNLNIERTGKSKQLYSLYDQLLGALIYLHFIVLILI